MLRLLFFLLAVVPLSAQTPAKPAATPAPAPAAAATPSPTPAPAAEPTISSLIDSMGPADLQQAVQLLKNNYINPEALNDAELNRAMLAGILARLGRGVMLLPQRVADPTEMANPFYSEVLEEHIGYLRLGALTPANLQAMDAALQKFAAKKIDALVVDLRATPSTNDFATAAEFAKRLTPRGKALFTLRKPAVKQERPFLADRDPAYQGMLIVLADGDTSGPGEAIAGTLRLHNKALVIGQATAGRAVEYADLPLNGGRVLRVAVAEAVLPEGRPLFPGGLKPDLPVEMATADKQVVFSESVEKGMGPFVYDAERRHMNEAALLAGRNPELEAMEAAQKRGRTGEKLPPRDPVMQRALDLVTSLAIYQQR